MNRVLSLFLHFAVAMSTSFKTLALHKDGADGAILTVTIKNTRSEVNVFCQETSIELNELVTVLQNDTSTKVVIFKSGNPEFFSAHYDIFPTPG